MLTPTRQKIDTSLVLFLQRVKSNYPFDLIHPKLYESIQEFILRKGKRLRPTLLVFSYKGYSTPGRRISPSIYYVSTCIELLHTFMLIHDDIIDRSKLRRGLPTLHRMLAKVAKTENQERFGNDLGIIAGDIIYALAIDAFLSVDAPPHHKEKALKYFIQTAVLTAMGEFIDTVHGTTKTNKIHESDVLLNYTLKTARYTFDCPLVVGAILAGAQSKEIPLLSRFGLLMGQAFQIQDDIIGIFSTQKNIGKSILTDIAESKKTILVCHAYRCLRGREKKNFLACFNKKHKTFSDLLAIRKIFLDSGSLDYSIREIQKRLHKAQAILPKLEMRNKYRTQIEKIFSQLYQPSQQIAEHYSIPFRL